MPPIRSQKGKDKFVDSGQTYRFDKLSKADGVTKFWRCDKKNVCKARIHTLEDRVVHRIHQHTHAGDAARTEVLTAITSMKERASTTQDTTGQIVTNGVANLTQAAMGALPSIACLKRTIQRKRVADVGAPPNPARLTDLIVPVDYTRYEKTPDTYEDFMLYDSGPASGDDRILIFSTERNLEILTNSTEWAMDGTFDIAPVLFTQVYSIHATFMERTLPLLYALMPNKHQRTYQNLFTNVNALTRQNAHPENVITDFELGAINAFRQTFPNARQVACFFHFSQNVYRRVQRAGLQQ